MTEKITQVIGKIPFEIKLAIELIRSGGANEDTKKAVEEWISCNDMRRNYFEAEIALPVELDQRSTAIITPTSLGTGLSRQGKAPR